MTSGSKIFIIGALCLIAGALIGNVIPFNKVTGGSVNTTASMDNADIRQIVADYIAQNPEKLVESLQSMQMRGQEEDMASARKAVQENADMLRKSPTSPTAGTGKSGITLVEFFDYRCGYCKRMSPTTIKLLEKHPDIKVVFKEFPILSEDSKLAAKAALAISKLAPEKYFQFHGMLMAHKGGYDQKTLNDYAGQVSVKTEAFEKEMKSDWILKELSEVADLAQKLGVRGTPAVIIGDDLLPGAVPFEELDSRIIELKG